MKTKLLFGILTVMLLSSCVKGVKTDLIKGISYSYNGLTLKDVVTYDTYKRVMNDNKLTENSTIYIEFNGVGNLTQDNGKVFPGCDLQVIDKDGNVVLEQKDIYSAYAEGADAANFVNPYVQVRLSDPITGGEKYDIEIHFYDKKKPENKINAKVEIDLSTSDLQVEKEEKGLTINNILLVDQETGILPSNIVKLNSKVAILLNNTEGFTEISGNVFLGCELAILDKLGKTIVYNEDIYKDIEHCPKDKVGQLMAIVTYADPMVAKETYTVKLRLFDKMDASKESYVSMDISIID